MYQNKINEKHDKTKVTLIQNTTNEIKLYIYVKQLFYTGSYRDSTLIIDSIDVKI